MPDEVRAAVVELTAIGRMPTTEESETDTVRADRWEVLIGEVYAAGGVTDAEAAALAQLFPTDDSDCYGVAWTLVHVVESAPGWPLAEPLDRLDGPWADVLRQRLQAA